MALKDSKRVTHSFMIAEFQIVASTASMLEEPSSILVNKLLISIASILLASNCLRNQVTQFETLCSGGGPKNKPDVSIGTYQGYNSTKGKIYVVGQSVDISTAISKSILFIGI